MYKNSCTNKTESLIRTIFLFYAKVNNSINRNRCTKERTRNKEVPKKLLFIVTLYIVNRIGLNGFSSDEAHPMTSVTGWEIGKGSDFPGEIEIGTDSAGRGVQPEYANTQGGDRLLEQRE